MTTTKLTTKFRNRNRDRKGQGLTEYVIIVGLVAILLIGAVKAFREKLQDTYERAAGKLESEVTMAIE